MADKPTLPPNHIGNIAAGHSREEENRRRTDSLAEAAAADSASAGSIRTDGTLMEEEPEILSQMNPFTMELEVTNKQAGRHYVWVLANSTIIASYTSMGYKAVQGDDPEAKEHKGQHKATASTLRGVGDVLLYWIPVERHAQIERHFDQKAAAINGVEENWAAEANYGPQSPTRQFGPLAHGDPNDPLLRRTVLRGTNGQIERTNQAIRTGQPLPAGVQVRG